VASRVSSDTCGKLLVRAGWQRASVRPADTPWRSGQPVNRTDTRTCRVAPANTSYSSETLGYVVPVSTLPPNHSSKAPSQRTTSESRERQPRRCKMASSGVPQRSRQSVARRASEGKRAGVVPRRRNQSRVPRASCQPGGRRPVSDEGHRAVFLPLRGPSRTVERARGDSLVSRLAERPRAIDSSARWSLAGMAASVSRASRSSVADRSPEEPVVPRRVVPCPALRAGRMSWVGLLTGKSDCRRSHAERMTPHAAERAGHEGQ